MDDREGTPALEALGAWRGGSAWVNKPRRKIWETGRSDISSFAAVAAMVALLAGCGGMKDDEDFVLQIPEEWETMDFELVSNGANELREALAGLDTVLAEKYPRVSQPFAPGAGDKEIAGLRAALGGRKIDELEVWFRWHNGRSDRIGQLLSLGSLISIPESLQRRSFFESIRRELLLPDIPADSLMILTDHGRGGYFLDLSLQPPLVFYDLGEIPEVDYFGSLPEFVGFVREGYEKGLLTIDERGLVDCSDEFFKNFTESHKRAATKP